MEFILKIKYTLYTKRFISKLLLYLNIKPTPTKKNIISPRSIINLSLLSEYLYTFVKNFSNTMFFRRFIILDLKSTGNKRHFLGYL